MTKRMDQTAGTVSFDNLIHAIDIPVKKQTLTIASGEGKLAKGTAIALKSNGKGVILGTTETVGQETVTCEANCILAEDIDATSADVVAQVFVNGHFNKNKLVFKTNYTLTAAAREKFRALGILLSDIVEI